MRKLAMVAAVLAVGSTSVGASAQARAARFGVERADVGAARVARTGVDRSPVDRGVRPVAPRELVRPRGEIVGATERPAVRPLAPGAPGSSGRQGAAGVSSPALQVKPSRADFDRPVVGRAGVERAAPRTVAGSSGSFPLVTPREYVACAHGSPGCGEASRERVITSPATPVATGGSAVLMKAAAPIAQARDAAARLFGRVSRSAAVCALVASEACTK